LCAHRDPKQINGWEIWKEDWENELLKKRLRKKIVKRN
jgi:hypothetical protein